MSGQNIWIIGASTGIGRALAMEYAQAGWMVFASGRSLATLQELARDAQQAGHRIVPLTLDVTSEESLKAAGKQLEAFPGHLQKVIISAGTCEYVEGLPVDMGLLRRVMETNFFGAVQAANVALPLLEHSVVTGREGQLAFLSSSVTYQPLPRAEAYGASKAALRYFVESLKADFQSTGIDFRVVSPGFVKTPLTDKNDFPMPDMISAETAAKKIVEGLASKVFDIHFPKRFTLALKALALLPVSLRVKLLGRVSRHTPEPSGNLP